MRRERVGSTRLGRGYEEYDQPVREFVILSRV